MNTLTLQAAKSLIGKEIITHYSGYRGQDGDDRFVVGDIVSEEFLGATEGWDGSKDTLVILTADGRNTWIKCHVNSKLYDEPTFTCSDADREVFYQEA